ncbi:MAG: hypothetical protein IPK19_29860 [Chloroflexi bacterium]|nr:hypothetical protein [Chloroflexota bacterium]
MDQNDGYLFEYLSYHLIEAGLEAELFSLLLNSPQWMLTKLSNSSINRSFGSDVDAAIARFKDPLQTAEQITTLVLLKVASWVSQHKIERIGDEELKALVWLNRENEAVRLAYLQPDPNSRVQALLAVQDAFREKNQEPPFTLERLRQQINAIPFPEDRATSLADLAWRWARHESVSTSHRLISDAIAELDKGLTKYDHVSSVFAVLTRVKKLDDADLLQQVYQRLLTRINGSADSRAYVETLINAYELMGYKHEYEQAVRSIFSLRHENNLYTNAFVISRLVDIESYEYALRAALEIENVFHKVVALGEIAAQCHKYQREEEATRSLDLAIPRAEPMAELMEKPV